MAGAADLIEKHASKGVLIDANLLVLYLVGKTNKNRILTFKRTQTYTLEDFELLEQMIARFSKVFTTPHVLTEVSNLVTLHGKELTSFRLLFKLMVERMDEFYDESRHVMADAGFDRLGLTDSAIASIARHDFLILTDDVTLQLMLERRGIDVINFNHIRVWNWQK